MLGRIGLDPGVMAEGLHEALPVLLLVQEAGLGGQGAQVVGVEAEGLIHRVDGVVDMSQMLAVPAPDLDPQVAGRVSILGLELLDDLGVIVEQVLPFMGLGGQLLELGSGLLVGVVLAKRRLQDQERPLQIVQLLFVDLGHRAEDVDALVPVLGNADPLEQDIVELIPAMLGPVDGLQPL